MRGCETGRSIFSHSILIAAAGAISVYAQSADVVRRSIPAPSAGRLTLTAESGGSIDVSRGSPGAIGVEVRFGGYLSSQGDIERMRRDFQLDIDKQGSDVRIEGRFRTLHNGWSLWSLFDGGFLTRVEYRVTLPPQTATARFETSGGSIAVGDLKGDIQAQTSGGSLHFGRIDGMVAGNTSGGSISLENSRGKAVLHTSGGSIHIAETGGDVDATTSGGGIGIDRAGGRIYAHTSGGGITVGEALNAVDASTSGGGIRIGLAAGKGFDLDASTSGGGVSCEFPLSGPGERNRKEIRGAVQGGGPLVRLHTSGGGIGILHARSGGLASAN